MFQNSENSPQNVQNADKTLFLHVQFAVAIARFAGLTKSPQKKDQNGLEKIKNRPQDGSKTASPKKSSALK